MVERDTDEELYSVPLLSVAADSTFLGTHPSRDSLSL